MSCDKVWNPEVHGRLFRDQCMTIRNVWQLYEKFTTSWYQSILIEKFFVTKVWHFLKLHSIESSGMHVPVYLDVSITSLQSFSEIMKSTTIRDFFIWRYAGLWRSIYLTRKECDVHDTIQPSKIFEIVVFFKTHLEHEWQKFLSGKRFGESTNYWENDMFENLRET